MKCPHCGSDKAEIIKMPADEFEYYHCRFCGGNSHIPRKSEPKVWE